MKNSGITIAAAAALALAAANALARNCTWTGGGDASRWSDASNWDGAAPAEGDTVIFAGTSGNAISTVNDISGLSLASIHCAGSDAVSIAGESVTLTGVQAWSNSVATACSIPIVINPSGNSTLTFYSSVAFNEDVVSLGTSGYLKLAGKGIASFYGHLMSTNQNVQCLVNSGGSARFYASTYFKNITSDAYVYGDLSFYTTNNVVGTISPVLWTCRMACEDAFADGTIWSWGTYYIENSAGRSFYQLNGNDQTIDRFDGSYRPASGGTLKPNCYAVRSTSLATLTLKATADCTTYANLYENISLVWDPVGDYTLHMPERAHATAGTITVKGGTMRISDAGSFAKVTALTVHDGATFDLASTNVSVRSLSALKKLTLLGSASLVVTNNTASFIADSQAELRVASTSRIVLKDGISQSVKFAFVDGLALASGTYTGEGGTTGTVVSWIDGTGTIVVDGSDVTTWNGSEDSDFNNAANWTDGLPAVDKVAYIAKTGNVTVNVEDEPAATVGSIYVESLSGTKVLDVSAPMSITGGVLSVDGDSTVRVSEGGTWLQDFTGVAASDSSETFAMHNGGSFVVDGGLVVLTNATGRIAIGGNGVGDAGTLQINSGTCAVRRVSGNFIQLYKNGTLKMTGGRFTSPYCAYIGQNGGRMDLSGDAYFESTDGGFHTILKTVTLRMSGDSVFKSTPESQGRWYFTPNASGETCLIEMSDNALMSIVNDSLYICHRDGAKTYVKMRGNSQLYSANGVYIGMGSGAYGELDIGDDAFFKQEYYNYGICFGSGGKSVSNPAKGVLKMSGGRITTGRSPSSATLMQGLMVGDGTAATYSGAASKGEVYMSGGVISNRTNAAFAIGAGSAEGLVEQSGGVIYHNGAKPVFVGFRGGVGEYEMTGGTLISVRSDVYVGGAQTNDVDYYLAPLDDKPAYGTLSVMGGIVDARRSIYVSAGGYGELEIGPTGLVQTAGNIYFTNSVDAVNSCTAPAQLTFTLGTDGCGQIVAASNCVVAADAQITVDATAYTGVKGMDLLTCAAMEGSFASENVEIVAPHPSRYRLAQRSTGLRLCCNSGAVIVFK